MGKARVHSSTATLWVLNEKNEPTQIGDIDSFSVRSLDELKTWQPTGESEMSSQTVFKGYELTFDGGKVDWELAALMFAQDKQIANGGRSPYFVVKQTIKHFNGKVECWTFPEVTLYGYELNAPNQDALTEKFTGFCGKKKTLNDGSDSAVSDSVKNKKTMFDLLVAKMAEKPENRS